MRLALRAGETESGDDPPSDPVPSREPYDLAPPAPAPPAPVRLRCYACAGRGRLWIMDQVWPRGREARCIVCRGCGRVTIP